jgi:hypothetical protein
LSCVTGVAIDLFVAVVVNVVSSACIAVAAVFFVENVVDSAANAKRFNAWYAVESVTEAEVAHKVRVERSFVAFGVVHVLFRYILRGERSVEAFVIEVERVVENEVGRERDWSVAVFDSDWIGPFVFVDVFNEVFDAVARYCGIESPFKPIDGMERSLKFDT